MNLQVCYRSMVVTLFASGLVACGGTTDKTSILDRANGGNLDIKNSKVVNPDQISRR